jgi:MFS family permease
LWSIKDDGGSIDVPFTEQISKPISEAFAGPLVSLPSPDVIVENPSRSRSTRCGTVGFMRARWTVSVLAALSALSACGYGVMFTMLDDFRDEYGIGPTALGGVIAIGFFSAFIAQIALSPLADRGYARRMVAIGIILDIAGLWIMAFGTTAVVLLLGRFVMGIGVGMSQPAIKRIAVLAAPDDLGGNLGIMLSADVAGFALGPAIAAVLVGPFGIPAPFLVVAGLTAVFAPIIARVHIDEGPTAANEGPRLALDLLRIRPLVAAMLLGAAMFLMIGAFDALWSLVLDDLEASELMANLGITLFAVPLVIFGPFAGRLAQRVGPFRLGSAGLLAGAVFITCYGVMPTAVMMFCVAMVHSLTDGLSISSSSVAVGMSVPAERQAAAHGLLGGMQTLVGGCTALLAGFLYDRFGRGVAYGTAAAGMVACVIGARVLAGDSFSSRGTPAITNDGIDGTDGVGLASTAPA